jgi:hypothetical protein
MAHNLGQHSGNQKKISELNAVPFMSAHHHVALISQIDSALSTMLLKVTSRFMDVAA